MKATFAIKFSGSNKGGHTTRNVTTEPRHPRMIAQISARMTQFFTVPEEVDMVEVGISVLQDDKGGVSYVNQIPKDVKLDESTLRWLEELAYRGCMEVESFEFAMGAFVIEDEVVRIVNRILRKPELAGQIDGITVEMAKLCLGCDGYHEDPAEMLEEIGEHAPTILKSFLASIGKLVGIGKQNGKSNGLTFRVFDEAIMRSPFVDLVPERLKPQVITAVKATVIRAFEDNGTYLATSVSALSESEREFEAMVVRQRGKFGKAREDLGKQATQLQELAAALSPHGFTDLPVFKLPAPKTEPIPELTSAPQATSGAQPTAAA